MENELYHWGVKGMKWGVRRYQNKDGSYTSAGRKRKRDNWSEDAKTVAEIKKKSVKEMTNAELRKLNERTRLENERKQLNPGAIQKGLKVAGTIVAATGTILALQSNGGKMIALGKNVGNKIIDAAGNMVLNDLRKHL